MGRRVLASGAAAIVALGVVAAQPAASDRRKPSATDARSVVAAFDRRSYRPGEIAVLKLWARYPHVRIELLHVGPERQLTVGDDTLKGVRVRRPFVVRGDQGSVRIRVSAWDSGLYAVRLTSGRKVGFAPFIVRPRRLGAQPVAVVLPTNTWGAYNYRDADGDGRPDTWYDNGNTTTVDLQRPYLNRGVPRHFRQNDLGFLRWLAHTGRRADVLSDEDVERVSGGRLAHLYRLIVYPGHNEYVTEREYDVVQRYRESRRRPCLPLREQLLLARQSQRRPHHPHSALAQPRSTGGCARRGAVLHVEPGQVRLEPVRRPRRERRAVALRRYRARER